MQFADVFIIKGEVHGSSKKLPPAGGMGAHAGTDGSAGFAVFRRRVKLVTIVKLLRGHILPAVMANTNLPWVAIRLYRPVCVSGFRAMIM